MAYAYVKKLKEGELSEGEYSYDVNRIDEEDLKIYVGDGGKEKNEDGTDKFPGAGYEVATEVEWTGNSAYPETSEAEAPVEEAVEEVKEEAAE